MRRSAVPARRHLLCLCQSGTRSPAQLPAFQASHGHGLLAPVKPGLQGHSKLHSTDSAAHKGRGPKRPRRAPLFLAAGAIGGLSYCHYTYISRPSAGGTTLNESSFVPYTITSREAVSAASFVFTVAPQTRDPAPPYLVLGSPPRWRYPQWSVEFKQPQVQIARHYTPLPPPPPPPLEEDERAADGSLRFYVRALGGGEMSTYLSRLGVGGEVWLRGPHAGFDVLARLGSRAEVVFLAGGTGIAPGMQVARAVLDRGDDARVSILWAVRSRSELQSAKVEVERGSWWGLGRGGKTRGAVEVDESLQEASAVARELKEMKARYGNRLRIQVGIDEESTSFKEADIQHAILPTKTPSQPRNEIQEQGCQLHDPALLQHAPEFEAPGKPCGCRAIGGHADAKPGKNLLIVSGPDGFVSHFAGPKNWTGGQQVQGPVGGIAARLQRAHPQLADEWLVLKL